MNCLTIAIMFIHPSVCRQSGMGVYCDHMLHVRTDLSLWLDSPMFLAPWHQSMSTYSHPSFSSSIRNRGGAWMCKLGLDINTNIDKEVVCRWI